LKFEQQSYQLTLVIEHSQHQFKFKIKIYLVRRQQIEYNWGSFRILNLQRQIIATYLHVSSMWSIIKVKVTVIIECYSKQGLISIFQLKHRDLDARYEVRKTTILMTLYTIKQHIATYYWQCSSLTTVGMVWMGENYIKHKQAM
jgi:hypothetical protein